MANKSGHNSFYTNGNAKKSSDNKNINIDWNRIRKIGMRIFKWAIFIFLAITTLWGCVQEFTITTSQFLSQGMETYMNEDEVLPNLYYLDKEFGYSSIVAGTEDDTVVPFENILYPVATNTTNNSVVASQSTIQYLDATSAHQFEIDNEQSIKDGNSISFLVDSLASSISISNIATINYLMLFDQTQMIDSSSILIPFVAYENYGTDNQTQNWYISDVTSSTTLTPIYRIFDDKQVKDFLAGDELTSGDAKRINIINQSLFYTNYFGFILGNSITPGDIQLSNSEGVNSGKTLQTIIDEQLAFENTNLGNYYSRYGSSTPYTTIDWNTMLNVGTNSRAGVNYFVTTPTRQDNYKPSEDTYNWLYNEGGINEIRDENWDTAPTSDKANSDFRDPSTSNAGWLFMDTKGNPINLYDSSLVGSDPESATPSKIFAAQTINDDFVASGYSATTISDIETEIQSGAYVVPYNDSAKITVDNETYKMEINQLINLSGFTSQENLVELQNNAYNQTYLVNNVPNSIKESNQERYNKSRIAISSWGEAWTYGPFYGMFVYPISVIAQWLSNLFQWQSIGSWAILISIFIIVFVFRGLAALISLKSTRNQQKMQELQIKVAQINAKYEMYKDNKNMKQRKQMEVMALYKKENVSPFSSIGSIFLTLPIFLALWTIISTLPLYKVAAFGKFSLSVSPMYGILHLMFVTAGLYLIVAILVGFVQYISFKVPNYLAQKRQGIKNIDDATKAQMKKNGRVTTIMLVVFIIIGLTIPTLLAIYWVFSALFSIALAILQHYLQERKAKSKKEG